MTYTNPPLSLAQLNQRVQDLAEQHGVTAARIRLMMCTLVVSQLLPDSVVIKGGMGIKLRMGEQGTRATSDFDVSSLDRGDEFVESFQARLERGWGTVPASKGSLKRDPGAPARVAFTGNLRQKSIHDPGLEKPQYVVHPYRVSLFFLGKPWSGLDVEVSDAEVAPAAFNHCLVAPELLELGNEFGFGPLSAVALIDVEYQIAQKLHAVTDPAYQRPHDLVDLQLLWGSGPDVTVTGELCRTVFAWRQAQSWPPLPLRPMTGWERGYRDARQECGVPDERLVAVDLDSAQQWLHKVITALTQAPAPQQPPHAPPDPPSSAPR